MSAVAGSSDGRYRGAASSVRMWSNKAETWLRRAVEIPAAVLVIAEVAILFIGICSRSLGRPIIWSDELASLLFLWLATFGVGVLAGVPIAFSFALATVAYLMAATQTPLTIVVGRMDEGMSGLILLAIPLFVLLGQRLRQRAWRGRWSISLPPCSDTSKAACPMSCLAPCCWCRVPPDRRPLTWRRWRRSIAGLFRAGILPAIVLALVLAVVARYRAGREEEAAPAARAKVRVVAKTFLVAFPALLLPFVIRTAVVEGVATATEVPTIGIVYSLLLGALVY